MNRLYIGHSVDRGPKDHSTKAHIMANFRIRDNGEGVSLPPAACEDDSNGERKVYEHSPHEEEKDNDEERGSSCSVQGPRRSGSFQRVFG